MMDTGRNRMVNRRASDDNRGKCPPNDPRDVPETPPDQSQPAPVQEPPDPEAPPYVVGTSWRADRRNRFEF